MQARAVAVEGMDAAETADLVSDMALLARLPTMVVVAAAAPTSVRYDHNQCKCDSVGCRGMRLVHDRGLAFHRGNQ